MLSTMNMKYKIKFHCKQPLQTRMECSRQILIPHDWHCSADFGALSFSVFMWQLAMCNWYLLLCPVPLSLLSTFSTSSSTKSAVARSILFSQLHAGCQAIQTFLLSMWKSLGFCQIPVEVIWRCAWNTESFFKHHTAFPLTLAYPT